MEQESYLQFPAKVRPKLKGGNLHRVRVDRSGLEVATLENLFGNKESHPVLKVKLTEITSAMYIPPRFLSNVGYCMIRYLDNSGQAQTLKFRVLCQGAFEGNIVAVLLQNRETEAIAMVLEELTKERICLLPWPVTLSFTPPNTARKFFFGLSLFALMLATAALWGKSAFLWFFGTFLLCMSLAAVSIDYIRIRTGWHWVVKTFVYVAVFLVAFVSFVTAMALFETINLI
jgi:hypothetical protein